MRDLFYDQKFYVKSHEMRPGNKSVTGAHMKKNCITRLERKNNLNYLNNKSKDVRE